MSSLEKRIRQWIDATGVAEPIRRSALIELLRGARRRRTAARSRSRQQTRYPGADRTALPIVFGNGMAKSGSHLLEQFLEGLTEVSPLAFTATHPVRTIAPEGRPRPDSLVMQELSWLAPGDMAWGYVPSREPFLALMSQPPWASFFILRDPRDRVISHILFATDLHPRHAMKQYYRDLPTMEARIHATILGVPNLVPSVTEAYGTYRGWFTCPRVLVVRFEDLVHQRAETVDRMIRHLENAGVPFEGSRPGLHASLEQAMSPSRSLTFRAGVSGAWREHFTAGNIETFKRSTGDLLRVLGYEAGDDW